MIYLISEYLVLWTRSGFRCQEKKNKRKNLKPSNLVLGFWDLVVSTLQNRAALVKGNGTPMGVAQSVGPGFFTACRNYA